MKRSKELIKLKNEYNQLEAIIKAKRKRIRDIKKTLIDYYRTGDKVKIVNKKNKYFGEVGYITRIKKTMLFFKNDMYPRIELNATDIDLIKPTEEK